MNRKAYLIIITVATVICIIGGTLYHVAGFLSYRPNSSETSYKEDLTASNIRNINIDMDAMAVRFEEGDTLSYSYDGPDNLTPTVDISGDTITIESHGKIKIGFGVNNNDGGQFIIYVPKGTSFKRVNINLDFGDIQIKNLICESLDVEADAGNVEINESEFDNSDIEAALGNIETHNTLLGASNISCDMGNVEIYDADINSLNISNDLGNTEVYLIGRESDYKFDLSVDLGSLEFNGKKLRGNFNSEVSEGKPVTIENDMGNITVRCR